MEPHRPSCFCLLLPLPSPAFTLVVCGGGEQGIEWSYWGGGQYNMGKGCFTGGIFMCSDVAGACRAWDARVNPELIGEARGPGRGRDVA